MNKRFLLFITALLFIGLTACSNDVDNDVSNDDLDEIEDIVVLQVDLDVPETADVNEEVTFSSKVTYGDEVVDDADKVEYEVWENGKKEDSEFFEATNEKDGTYTLTHSFNKDANYTVQVHVDAKEQHVMPKEEIIVGKGHDEEIKENEFTTDGFELKFNHPEDISINEEQTLQTNIKLNEEALNDLNVRYEISSAENEIIDWIDTVETAEGQYESTYTFEQSGKYIITIHVEDDEDLHEHADYEINVS